MSKKIIKSIGLDLSLVKTGVIILKDGKITTQHLITSKPSGPLPIDELKRIRKIVEDIEIIISEDIPDIGVIEGMAYMARNTTALVQLAALNYMTRALLFDYGIPFLIVAPTTLKKFITGSGASSKDIMMLEVYKKYGVTILDNNENDAFGLAQIGFALLKTRKMIRTEQEVIDLLKVQL